MCEKEIYVYIRGGLRKRNTGRERERERITRKERPRKREQRAYKRIHERERGVKGGERERGGRSYVCSLTFLCDHEF